MAWLIYALGGGFGHLTRSSALARAAHPDIRARILTNSPYTACVQRAMPELDCVTIDPAMTTAEARIEAVCQIESAAMDCLIVDTFPRGLAGELADVVPSFAGPRVYVQRDLNPQYSAAFDLNVFVRNSYDLVVIPGDATVDGLGPFPQTATTTPWLVRSPQELFSREDARRLLGVRAEGPCAIVCAAGNPEELDWYGAVVSHLEPECEVRCIAPVCPHGCPPECWLSYWPAMDLYAAADVVVGGAGYNTIYECLACQVPLVARPWPRKYDRQGLRAARHGAIIIVNEPGQAAAAAIEILASRPKESDLQFHNGATDAVAAIREITR